MFGVTLLSGKPRKSHYSLLIFICPAHRQQELQTLHLIQLAVRVELHWHKVLIGVTVSQ